MSEELEGPGWRIAKSLETLRGQVNAIAPERDKSSDGTIGDTSHAARKSDHNPNSAGVVQAMDISNDPAHGIIARALAEALVASRDPRIKYVISNKQINSSKVSPWKWRPYNGANAHQKHVHVSVMDDPALYDDPAPWKITAEQLSSGQVPPTPKPRKPKPTPVTIPPPVPGIQPGTGLDALVRQWVFDRSGVTAEIAELRKTAQAALAANQALLATLDQLQGAGKPPTPPIGPDVTPWLKLPPPPPEPAPAPAKRDRFADCVALVLRDEGGNDDDPRDPGGRTSRGITKGDWDDWRKTHPGLPSDVWQAPQDQVIEIYRQKYWNGLHCDELPAGIDYAVFDYGVNSGIHRVVPALQHLVGTPADGIIGPQTIAATNKANAGTLIDQLCDQRMTYLRTKETWPTFGRGWTNRVERVRKAAAEMAATTGAKSMSNGTPDKVTVPVKSPIESKVNWTALAILATNVISLVSKGKITLDPDQIVNMIGIVGPAAIMIFRTFFNFSVAPQSLPSK